MDETTRVRIGELRAKGLTPKEIARATKQSPSAVAEVIRELAVTRPKAMPPPPYLECFASAQWRVGLGLKGGEAALVPQWMGALEPGLPQLTTVAVLAGGSPSMFDISVLLIDAGCLGVKNSYCKQDVGPAYARHFFESATNGPTGAMVPITLGTARELVFGAVDYARALGFEPRGTYARCVAPLGAWTGPGVLLFGQAGRPFYVEGPRDDAAAIVEKLRNTLGDGGFDFTVRL